MTEQTQDISSQKNISDKWLEGLHDNLSRLESYQRLADEGCTSIMDYVQSMVRNPQQGLSLPMIQYKNFKLFSSELNTTLTKIPKLIDPKELKEIQTRYILLKAHERRTNGYLTYTVDQRNDTKRPTLKPEFTFALEQMSKLFEMLNTSLWKLLSPNAKEGYEGPPR